MHTIARVLALNLYVWTARWERVEVREESPFRFYLHTQNPFRRGTREGRCGGGNIFYSIYMSKRFRSNPCWIRTAGRWALKFDACGELVDSISIARGDDGYANALGEDRRGTYERGNDVMREEL